MRLKRWTLFATILLSILSSFSSYGNTITFENIPGIGEPFEGMEISTQFLETAGVSFSLEGGGFPHIAKVGSPATAFGGWPNHKGPDTPAPGQDIGSFFLTDDGVLAGLTSPALIVTYSSPTAKASGVILDIDLGERFTIQPLDDTGSVLDTVTISAGDPGTGDGIATPWSIDLGDSEIYSIRFEGSRTTPGAFGLGFDNFTVVPIPSSFLLLAFGLLGLFSFMHKNAA